MLMSGLQRAVSDPCSPCYAAKQRWARTPVNTVRLVLPWGCPACGPVLHHAGCILPTLGKAVLEVFLV